MDTIPVSEIQTAAVRLDEVLRRFEGKPIWAQLKIKMREESRENELDEVHQYEILRSVARRNPLLAESLIAAEFALDTNWADRNIDPEEGLLVQAFNYWIENVVRWDRV